MPRKMYWNCPLCTYKNSSSVEICEMCNQGLQCLAASPFEDEDEIQFCEQIHSQNQPEKKKDIYVRDDGQLLFNEEASDERKRAIAKRKALDLHKLLQNPTHQSKKQKQAKTQCYSTSVYAKINSSSKFSTNVGYSTAVGASATAFASTSKGHANVCNVHAKGVNASASATADGFVVSALNARATGTNASASASASARHVTALNVNATGVNTSVSAHADGFSAAVGNVSVTGAEAAASVSVSAARVQIGNIDVNGVSAGASARVNGSGITAGNIAIGGPSAAASINVDGSISFGNINLGLRPSLDIGFGLNLGIPFLSGSKMGSEGNAGAGGSNGEQGTGGNQGASGLEKIQEYLSSKFPNQRIYKTPVDVSITQNKDGQAIDPVLPEFSSKQTDTNNVDVKDVIERHNALVQDGKKFVGFKGCPPQSSTTNLPSTEASNVTPTPATTSATSNSIWSGMYTSPNPDVAAGYVADDRGRAGDIKRIYLPADAANHYYTKTGLETPEAKVALAEIKVHSNDKYIFSGPQDSIKPDLLAPETVISTSVRDEAKASNALLFEKSAHKVDPNSYKLIQFHPDELECSEIVPDYLVNIKTTADCEKTGGRERLAHVFQGRPSSGYCNDLTTVQATDQSQQVEITEEDKLLLEECAKLGDDLTFNELNHLKKNLKRDEEYEREEDLSRKSTTENSNTNISNQNKTSETKDEEETITEPPEPCKNHPNNVRCMKCMQGSSGPRIRKIRGRIHGFSFKD